MRYFWLGDTLPRYARSLGMITKALTCRSKYISRKYITCINKTKDIKFCIYMYHMFVYKIHCYRWYMYRRLEEKDTVSQVGLGMFLANMYRIYSTCCWQVLEWMKFKDNTAIMTPASSALSWNISLSSTPHPPQPEKQTIINPVFSKSHLQQPRKHNNNQQPSFLHTPSITAYKT